MNRTGLYHWLVIAAVNGLVFGVFPDLSCASRSISMTLSMPAIMCLRGVLSAADAGARHRTVGSHRDHPFLVLVALAISSCCPTRNVDSGTCHHIPGCDLGAGPRAVGQCHSQGPLGRSRPIDITQLGGTERYVRWWDPRGDCPNNCSFV